MPGGGPRARYRSNSRAIARIRAAGEATPQTAPDRACAKPLSRRGGAKSGDLLRAVSCLHPGASKSHRFELIPIALQRGCVEIVNTLLDP